jgi:hypothetical protein
MRMISNVRSRILHSAALLILCAVAAPNAVAAETPADESGKRADAATEPPAPAPAATMEETLRQQGEMLVQMRDMMLKQQEEIARLRSELDAVRRSDAVPASTVASGSPSLTPHAATAANDAAVLPAAGGSESASPSAQADDEWKKKVDDVVKRWGSLRFSGDLRFRYETFVNQGFDATQDVKARNRLRVRARAQIASQINKNFDWAIRLASGSFVDPISTNQTLDNFYNRKPFALDRAFLHFTTATKEANFEVYAGKFDYTWKRTVLTFDNDLQPEGLSERFSMNFDDSPLKTLQLTAWQLPYKERSVGADAVLFGGQILTDWKLSDNWSSSFSGTFHDFEQVNVIPAVVGIAPTVVNLGFEYGTTNVVVINPFTGVPEYRSDYRVIDAIGELRYTGFGEGGKDTKWPLAFRLNWIHNTSAFNNQKDGGLAMIEFGRRAEKDDLFLAYEFFKIEREATPSVFVESDILQTNALNHRVTASYSYLRNVVFEMQYILSRRLQTTSPVNRWLNRFQFDVIYKF